MQKVKEFQAGSPESGDQVIYELYQIGRDWLLVIGGGISHIGSVASSERINGKEELHQFTFQGHKEDKIVENAQRRLREITPGNILVIGGIHYEAISSAQIEKIVNHCETLLGKVEAFFTDSSHFS